MTNVQNFVQEFKDKKIANNRIDPDAVSKYIREKIEFTPYIPFRQKREIAEMIVAKNTVEVDGIKKYDSLNAYIGLIVSSIAAHSDLQFGSDPVSDYDALVESGLLNEIISEFKASYDELEVILKAVVAMEMEDNNTNVIVGRFLNGILDKLDIVTNVLGEKVKDFDMTKLLGDIKQEDLASLMGLVNKLK